MIVFNSGILPLLSLAVVVLILTKFWKAFLLLDLKTVDILLVIAPGTSGGLLALFAASAVVSWQPM